MAKNSSGCEQKVSWRGGEINTKAGGNGQSKRAGWRLVFPRSAIDERNIADSYADGFEQPAAGSALPHPAAGDVKRVVTKSTHRRARLDQLPAESRRRVLAEGQFEHLVPPQYNLAGVEALVEANQVVWSIHRAANQR